MTFLDRWQALSPMLDEVLDLEPAERSAWIERLRASDPQKAADLEALVEEHFALQQDEFLRGRAATPAPAPPGEGDPVGAYTLLSPIGHGGMGTVWLAKRNDGRFDRPAAIKFLNAALASRGEARFRREGAILARLTHPNIAQLLDAGVASGGQPFLVLEYVAGERIDAYCDARRLDLDARLPLLIDVICAVAHAHASLVVHRDIKPSNVLVRADGVVKLLDFGIATLIEDETAAGMTALTRDGAAAMTPEFAAPEQVTGDPVTAATDVYALGVLAYLLLAGRHPTIGTVRTPASIIKSIVDVEPRRASDAAPRDRAPRLRGDLDTILAKALKKVPEERYLTAAAFADDLQRYLRHEPVRARPDTLRYRARKFVRRNRVAVALGAAACLAAAIGLAGTLSQARAAREERDYAVQQLARAEAINDLNNFVLYDAAPGGKPFTVNDLLADAERIVRRQRGDEVNQIGMLVSIGREYWSGDEEAKARAVLQDAYDRSRRVGDPAIRARASCALASAMSKVAGGQARADALYGEGMRELPSGQRFILDRIFCLQRGSEISRELGRSHEGVARAAEAERLVSQAPFRSDVLAFNAETALAEALRMDGREREAAAAFERAAPTLTALGRDGTQTAGTVFNNWGLTLSQLGRTADAERVLRRAIAISRDNNGEEAVSPMLLNNYARVLRDLGRLDEAADYAQRACDKARAAGDGVVINQSLIVRGAIYREQREFRRSEEMFDEVEPRLRQHLPPTHVAFASLASERALLAQASGDLPAALSLADRSVRMAEASQRDGGQGADYVPILLARKAGIELQLGRVAEAAIDAGRAVDLLKASVAPGNPSMQLGRAYATLAGAQKALGNLESASANFRTAIDHLQRALGADNSETVAVRQLAAVTQTARR